MDAAFGVNQAIITLLFASATFVPTPPFFPLFLLSLHENVNNLWRVVKVRQHDVLSLNLCVSAARLQCICLRVHPRGEVCVSERARGVCSVCFLFLGTSQTECILGKRYEFSQASMILRVSSLSFLIFLFLSSLLQSSLFLFSDSACNSFVSSPSLLPPLPPFPLNLPFLLPPLHNRNITE